MAKKTKGQVNAEAVISIQAKLDFANAEIERLNKTIRLTAQQFKLMAWCLGDGE